MNDARSLLEPERWFPGSETLATIFSLAADQSNPRCLRLLTSMACRIPEVHSQLQGLICLAEEAGISHEGPGALLSALILNDQLDQLLASDWQRAEEILDPEEVIGVDHRALMRLAQSRCREGPFLFRIARSGYTQRTVRRVGCHLVIDVQSRTLEDLAVTIELAKGGPGDGPEESGFHDDRPCRRWY